MPGKVLKSPGNGEIGKSGARTCRCNRPRPGEAADGRFGFKVVTRWPERAGGKPISLIEWIGRNAFGICF